MDSLSQSLLLLWQNYLERGEYMDSDKSNKELSKSKIGRLDAIVSGMWNHKYLKLKNQYYLTLKADIKILYMAEYSPDQLVNYSAILKSYENKVHNHH